RDRGPSSRSAAARQATSPARAPPPGEARSPGHSPFGMDPRQQFEHAAQQATLADYLGEVDHGGERVRRLELAIDEAIARAPAQTKALVEGLQALRGVGKLTATTLAVEIGSFSRFDSAKQLMAFCGVVPSEHSSGDTKRKG